MVLFSKVYASPISSGYASTHSTPGPYETSSHEQPVYPTSEHTPPAYSQSNVYYSVKPSTQKSKCYVTIKPTTTKKHKCTKCSTHSTVDFTYTTTTIYVEPSSSSDNPYLPTSSYSQSTCSSSTLSHSTKNYY
ncbi:hypothetical protein BB560_000706 [Smittium megazygosporum]|uniref:Uncharacterized protein n=1 Tax=Smittium megazygosporum TaxID=133381 RepID=A0A2T9ZJL8_9FUNG|nr:hypothetical protein BB560_000706 [Smittium megazygosporum]